MTIEARKVVHLVYEQIVPTGKLIQMVKQIGKNQLEVDQKVNLIQAQITKLTDNYDILEKLKKQYTDLEVDIKALKAEVDKLEAKKEAIGDKDPYNCDGMLGYENESPGDGINAFYYDNEDFIGEPKVVKKDNQVDFSWDNEEPTEGINQDNFSIKWKFWLRVPVKGKYNFYSESDDGH